MANADIIAKVSADTSQLQADLNKAKGVGQSFASSFSAIGKTIAGAFTISAIARFSMEMSNYAEQIQNISALTGLHTDSVQALGNVLEMSGGSVSQLQTMMMKLQKAISEANSGNKTFIKDFETMGITLDELATAKPEKILEKLAISLVNGGNNSAQFASAISILGKDLTEINQLMMEIANNGIQGIVDKQNELGQILTGDALTAWDTFGDKISMITKRAKNEFADLGNDLMKLTVGLLEYLKLKEKEVKTETYNKPANERINPNKFTYDMPKDISQERVNRLNELVLQMQQGISEANKKGEPWEAKAKAIALEEYQDELNAINNILNVEKAVADINAKTNAEAEKQRQKELTDLQKKQELETKIYELNKEAIQAKLAGNKVVEAQKLFEKQLAENELSDVQAKLDKQEQAKQKQLNTIDDEMQTVKDDAKTKLQNLNINTPVQASNDFARIGGFIGNQRDNRREENNRQNSLMVEQNKISKETNELLKKLINKREEVANATFAP